MTNTPGPALPPLPDTTDDTMRDILRLIDEVCVKYAGRPAPERLASKIDLIVAIRSYALKAVEAYREDKARLDWLESINKPFQMEWHILRSPAGNVGIRSVINLSGVPQESFREAIDKARAAIAAAVKD